MRFWLDFAEGPMFRFCFLVMVLGLARLVVLAVRSISRMKARTPDKSSDYWALFVAGLKWLWPRRWLMVERAHYTAASVIFHIGLVLVPIFFLPHITLWREGIGFGWPNVNALAADVMTLMTITAGIVLVVLRATDKGSRRMSHPEDWLLTPLCVIVFVSGYLAAHPTTSPLSYDTMRLIHVLAGNVILFIIPFTKLSHIVMLPFTHIITDLSWKFVPGVGEKVRVAIGHKDRPI